MKLSKQFTLGFGLILGFLVILITFFSITVKVIVDKYNGLISNETAILELAEEVKIDMLQCRRSEKDFRLRLNLKYQQKNSEALKAIKRDAAKISTLAEKNNLTAIKTQTEAIITKAETYHQAFTNLVKAWKIKGLNHKSGLRKQFRSAAHNLAAEMKMFDIPELQIGFLQVRRYEKDFQRTKSDNYKMKWQAALVNYRHLLEQSNCEAEAKKIQQQGLSGYATAMAAYLDAVSKKSPDQNAIYDKLRGSHSKTISHGINMAFVQDVNELLLTIRKHEKDYIMRQDKTYQAKLEQTISTLKAEFEQAKKDGVPSGKVATVFQLLNKYQDAFNKLVTQDDIIRAELATLTNAVRDIEPLVDQIADEAKTLIISRNKETMSLSNTLMIIADAVGVVILIIGIITAVIISRVIKKPIVKAVKFANEISNNNYNNRMNYQTEGEIGDLANALDGMADALQEHERRMQQNMAEMADVLSNVDRVAGEINCGSQQISAASQALSQGAVESAASIEEISSSVTELTSQVKNNAANASQANQLSLAAKESAESGNCQIDNMVNAMAEINQSSEKISKINKVIDDIAFQTNILALNAAVEAARAGVHGKGFAVVAEEVRNLAARSAKAASEASELIEQSSSNVEQGSRIAGETAEAFQAIVSQVDKVNSLVAEIAASSNEQSQGITEISQGLQQIDSVTQQNTASAEETAASTVELANQADALQAILQKYGNRSNQQPDVNTTEPPPTKSHSTPHSRQVDSSWGGSNLLPNQLPAYTMKAEKPISFS